MENKEFTPQNIILHKGNKLVGYTIDMNNKFISYKVYDDLGSTEINNMKRIFSQYDYKFIDEGNNTS